MAHCEAPSFSLGLDFTLDSQPLSPYSPIDPPPSNHDHDWAQLHIPNSDPDTGPDPPRRILKRLRRGPPPPHNQPYPPPPQQPPLNGDDEDIEEFSSQDDDLVQVHAHSSTRNHSVCSSSSKVSLNSSGVLTPHSSRVTKRKQTCFDDVPASTKMETGHSGLVFPKLTTSPLRRFQLLSDSDSDSDDPVVDIAVSNQRKNAAPLQQSTMKTKFSVDQDHDLWKDFSPVKNFPSIPTPAFDEVCEEYFQSAKNKGAEESGIDVAGSCRERCLGVNMTKNKEVEKSGIDMTGSRGEGCSGVNSSFQMDQQLWESTSPLPPAHRYFFHEDPRIQQLVRSRLYNFLPLGVNRVNQQPNVSHIDYMGQFGNGGASGQKGSVKSSTRGNNKSRNLAVEENFGASGGWVDPKVVSTFTNGESSRKKATKRNSSKNGASRGKNKTNKSSSSNVSCSSANWVEPKSCTNMPKDAGKRRVQASGQSAGHWYTSPEGRKVYVNKSGQELTGQIAYRQYRRESGAGIRKSKKKTSAKKTNAKKRN